MSSVLLSFWSYFQITLAPEMLSKHFKISKIDLEEAVLKYVKFNVRVVEELGVSAYFLNQSKIGW